MTNFALRRLEMSRRNTLWLIRHTKQDILTLTTLGKSHSQESAHLAKLKRELIKIEEAIEVYTS